LAEPLAGFPPIRTISTVPAWRCSLSSAQKPARQQFLMWPSIAAPLFSELKGSQTMEALTARRGFVLLSMADLPISRKIQE
jgi:hypothetical protein